VKTAITLVTALTLSGCAGAESNCAQALAKIPGEARLAWADVSHGHEVKLLVAVLTPEQVASSLQLAPAAPPDPARLGPIVERLHAQKLQALSQLQLGRARVVGETRLGPEVVLAVSDAESLCTLARQPRVTSIYLDKPLIPDGAAPAQ
jgi:hypothetical protein